MKKDFETFDLWGKSQFVLWSQARYDFELINEALDNFYYPSQTLPVLHKVNSYLKNKNEKTFFDGTITCLKRLVSNGNLNIDDIETKSEDDKILVKLLKKYVGIKTIYDLCDHIEDNAFRAMYYEYPNIIDVIDPHHRNLIFGKALYNAGIRKAGDLDKFIEDSKNTDAYTPPPDKNDNQSMKCKLIFIGLILYSEKLKLVNDSRMIDEFKNLTDRKIEDGDYTKTIFNSLYSAFYPELHPERKVQLSGQDEFRVQTTLLNFRAVHENHMTVLYDIFFKDLVKKTIKKYGYTYKTDGGIENLAITDAIVITLFRANDFVPKDEQKDYYLPLPICLHGLNYGIYQKENGELGLKDWFVKYFTEELNKRTAFIKLLEKNKVSVLSIFSKNKRVIYIPVFESYNFFAIPYTGTLIKNLINIFSNRGISSEIKDDMLVNIAINIQKLTTLDERDKTDNLSNINHQLILLLVESFLNLSKKSFHEAERLSKYNSKSYLDSDDFDSIMRTAIIEAILVFDLTKNRSFLGYMKTNLKFVISKEIAGRKEDRVTTPISQISICTGPHSLDTGLVS